MKTPGTPDNPTEEAVEAALCTFGISNNSHPRYEASVESVVSPVHRGVESACFNIETDDATFFLKIRYPDMADYFQETDVYTVALRASQLGVGAQLINADTTSGSYLFDRLDDSWSWGKVDNFRNITVLENTVNAKRMLHRSDALSSGNSVFTTIEHYYSIIKQRGYRLPNTLDAVLEKVRSIDKAITATGVDKVPCHGDGIASNVMISESGNIRLVDFDSAGNHDPYFDLGSLIIEIAQHPDLARSVLEIYNGECREADFNRCMLYGIADDLKWAFWGFISFSQSLRSHVEFMKYAEWRLLRAILNTENPHFHRWIAKL